MFCNPLSSFTICASANGNMERRIFMTWLMIFSLIGFGSSYVFAEQVHKGTKHNNDGSYNELWYSEEHDVYYIKAYDKEGNLTATYVNVNPNPDDGETTPGDQSMREALLLQRGGGGRPPIPAFEKTPVGKHQTANGKGPVVLWNPSDEQGGSGRNSTGKGVNDLNLKEMFEEKSGFGTGQTTGFHVNGQAINSQVKNMIKKGNGGDNSNPLQRRENDTLIFETRKRNSGSRALKPTSRKNMFA